MHAMSLPRLFPGSLCDAIFHCRRRDGVAEAARNAMKRSEANKVTANPHGKGDAARNAMKQSEAIQPGKDRRPIAICGPPRSAASRSRFGGNDGRCPDRKPRGAQHEAQTLFVAAKVIGAGTAGMGERIHGTAFLQRARKTNADYCYIIPLEVLVNRKRDKHI